MLSIQHLSKNYGPLHAVSDLCLDVPPGQIFAFLGPNGAGKTTTIKIATGLLKPSSGSVTIAGLNVQEHPVEVKRMVGYIPDMPFLYDRLTPPEFMAFIGELYDIPRDTITARTHEFFSLFGLLDHRQALIRELSHGMRQRLIYSATFLHDPRVLFIDEPLIGLDPHTIRLVKDLLIQKARQGITVFLTTHILALAEDIADRIGIISGGRLIATGTLPELLRQSREAQNLESLFLDLTRDNTE